MVFLRSNIGIHPRTTISERRRRFESPRSVALNIIFYILLFQLKFASLYPKYILIIQYFVIIFFKNISYFVLILKNIIHLIKTYIYLQVHEVKLNTLIYNFYKLPVINQFNQISK